MKIGEVKATAKNGVTVAYTDAKGGNAQKLEADQPDRLDRPRAQHRRPRTPKPSA